MKSKSNLNHYDSISSVNSCDSDTQDTHIDLSDDYGQNIDSRDEEFLIFQDMDADSQNHELITQGRIKVRARSKREKKKQKRNRKKESVSDKAKSDEEVKILFDVEEGYSTDSNYEAEKAKSRHRRRISQHKRKSREKNSTMNYHVIFFFSIGIFLLSLLLMWRLFLRKDVRFMPVVKNNGTRIFLPTTILISLDGFRPDFLNRGITPRLNKMREEGFSPAYMSPSFPSVTFPNHYTLVTGLYPESHGIVSNVFWDEETKEEFYYTKPEAMHSKWWGGEPLWVTAEKQGVRTAVHMWPGSEANVMGVKPTFLDKFNFKTTMREKAERVLELLDVEDHENNLHGLSRPQLIATYVPHVDVDGHYYGPNTTEMRNTISNADQMLDEIYLGLERRNMTDEVNVIVVSDHGMATTDVNRMIQLDDLVDLSKVDHIDGWPNSGFHLKDDVDVLEFYEGLAKLAASNSNFEVYLTDTNMPERYHFSKNKRIAPVWIIPKTGWAIPTKEEFDVKESKLKGLQYHPRGLHGYDHDHPLMRSIFIARGPAFPHIPSNRIKPFQNIEVYNIVCDTLGLIPGSNNGTLRLPLLPIDPQEADITIEIVADLEVGLFPLSPEPQNISKTSFPLSGAPTSNGSFKDLIHSTEIGFESQILPKTPETLLNEENNELWNWLLEKSSQLKKWLEKSVVRKKIKFGHDSTIRDIE